MSTPAETPTGQAETPLLDMAEHGTASFVQGYAFGSRVAWEPAWRAGYEASEDEWLTWLSATRAVLDHPKFAAVHMAREATSTPCANACRACSRCVRFAAAFRNQRRYGSPDYPGTGAS